MIDCTEQVGPVAIHVYIYMYARIVEAEEGVLMWVQWAGEIWQSMDVNICIQCIFSLQ